jgi:transcriptional regulator with XRE-family HTH domain
MPELKRLKKLREARLLTQVELAQRAGVSEATVVRLELGQHPPRFATIKKLATALGVEPAELMGEPS